MAFTFEQLFAADPSNPSNVAQNASITIFEPGDGTMTPLEITDPDGSPLPNPFPVNANGFGPAFAHATLDRVAWLGGGFTGFVTSYEGMKQVALDAQTAAETAATTAGVEAAAVATAAIGTATDDAEAAAASAATAASNAAASATAAANSAALVGAPADTAIAAAINGTGATKTALNATYAPAPDSLNLDWLSRAAHIDSQASIGNARVVFEDAAQWIESWSDTTAWSKPGTDPSQVSAGRVYGTTAPNPSGITRPMPGGGSSLPNGSLLTVTTDLIVPGAGVAGYAMMLGVTSTATDPIVSGGGNFIGFGIQGSSGTPVGIVTMKNGVFTSVSGTALVAGTYRVTMVASETSVSWSLTNADHSIEHTAVMDRVTTPVPAYRVALWLGDNRGLSGSSFGPVGAKLAMSPATPIPAASKLADVAIRTTINGNAARIALPANYDPRKPSPLCVFFHPYTGTEQTPWTEANPRGVINALHAAGFIVAATVAPVPNDWGNAGAVTAYRDLYRYVRDHYAIGATVFYSESMGGLAGLLTLASREVPCQGWVGSMPVCNLRAAYDNGYMAPIKTAYGIASDGSDYATKTAGHDPALLDGKAFRGVPMRFYASPSDVSVYKTAHSDVLYGLVQPFARSAENISVTGGHTDASGFPATAIKDYLLSCVKA